jgi:hypothetical protein
MAGSDFDRDEEGGSAERRMIGSKIALCDFFKSFE